MWRSPPRALSVVSKIAGVLPRVLVVISFLSISACFPVATPPVVYNFDLETGAESSCMPAVLLTRAHPEQEFLGVQFVLGILPLTRMYTSESMAAMAERELEVLLRRHGFCVFRSSADFRDTLATDAVAPLILEIKEAQSFATVYDLFVVRRISVGGEITLSIAQAPHFNAIPLRVDFAAGKFGKTGYSLQVHKFLRYAFVEALEERVLPALHLRQRRANRSLNREKYLQILPPISASLPLSTYQLLEGDFETNLDAQRWPNELRFRLQQGIAAALVADSARQARIVWSMQSCCNLAADGWQLVSELREFSLSEQKSRMRLVVRFTLKKNNSLVRRTECQSDEALTEQARNLPLLGVSEVAEDLAREFYTSTGSHKTGASEEAASLSGSLQVTGSSQGRGLLCRDL